MGDTFRLSDANAAAVTRADFGSTNFYWSHRINLKTKRRIGNKPDINIFIGSLLLFVTFTQSQSDGITRYLAIYLPILGISFVLLSSLEHWTPKKIMLPFVGLLALVALAFISPNALNKTIALLIIGAVMVVFAPRGLKENLPTYAYYAMLGNIGIYTADLIFNGVMQLNFDPVVFNVIGAGRDETLSTWQFMRYSAHHDEPGSLAVNLTGLTLLSLQRGRRPNFSHWVAWLVLISTLSLTALIMSILLFIVLIFRSGISWKTILTIALVLFTLFQVSLQFDNNVFEYFQYRLIERDSFDSSIIVKSLLIDDMLNRDLIASLLGNRFEDCFHCSFSKSLGYGFHISFQGGLVGWVAVAAFFTYAVRRHGAMGFAIVVGLMLARFDVYYGQVLFYCFAITAKLGGSEANQSEFEHNRVQLPPLRAL